jgi:hypothetical protein
VIDIAGIKFGVVHSSHYLRFVETIFDRTFVSARLFQLRLLVQITTLFIVKFITENRVFDSMNRYENSMFTNKVKPSIIWGGKGKERVMTECVTDLDQRFSTQITPRPVFYHNLQFLGRG